VGLVGCWIDYQMNGLIGGFIEGLIGLWIDWRMD
jgi:hypothetical protein